MTEQAAALRQGTYKQDRIMDQSAGGVDDSTYDSSCDVIPSRLAPQGVSMFGPLARSDK
jgi:hypothetical protein